VLSEYIKSMTWKTGDRVLDLGCGPGSVTRQVLLPRLPADFGLLIGADLSADMVQYATDKYKHSKLKFTQFDLAKDIENTSQLQPSFFDKIFSFFCLHWIPDQRKALRNIYTLLRTGGEILLLFLGKQPVFTVYEIQSQKPEWQPYMKDAHQAVSPYHHSSNPGEEFRKLLHDTGFEVIDCEYRECEYSFDNPGCLRDLLKGVNPFVGRMPRELHDKYMTDCMTEIMETKMVETNNNTDNGVTLFKYGLIAAFARKT